MIEWGKQNMKTEEQIRKEVEEDFECLVKYGIEKKSKELKKEMEGIIKRNKKAEIEMMNKEVIRRSRHIFN